MKKRKQKRYELTEKWVVCLNCDHERVVETVIHERNEEGCPVCGSRAYEESTSEYNDWGE